MSLTRVEYWVHQGEKIGEEITHHFQGRSGRRLARETVERLNAVESTCCIAIERVVFAVLIYSGEKIDDGIEESEITWFNKLHFKKDEITKEDYY
jgi:hypothetical protein